MAYATEFSEEALERMLSEKITADECVDRIAPVLERKECVVLNWNIFDLEYTPEPDRITVHDIFGDFKSETLLIKDFWNEVRRHFAAGAKVTI